MPTLLFHTGALGDFITVLPALAVWKNRHPGDSLTLLGTPEIGPLAREIGYVDDHVDVTLSRYAPLFNDRLSPKTAEILLPFSHAIIFSSRESPLAGHCRKLGLDVYDQPAFPADRTHAVDYHVSLFIDPRTIPDDLRIPRVHAPESMREASFSLVPAGEKICVIHAGSGSVRKNWPFDCFLLVADSLRGQGRNIVWIKGPAESGFQFPRNDRVLENPRLSVLAALLQRAEFFLGNDSGIAHLAAASGCPSLVLFGPSDARVWSPRGDRVRIICKELPCAPCHLRDLAPQTCDRKCLTRITVEEVLDLTRPLAFPLL